MLALVGSGEYLPPMEVVDRELLRRLPGEAKVVCLPTAAGTEGDERIGYWSDLGVKHFSRLGAPVEALRVIDRESANDAGLAAVIAEANFVYLSGGKPDYLYRTLEGSRVWEAICGVLAAGGLLAGCSAGAMIMGEKFYGFPGMRQGFNLLPGVTVIPHFDEMRGELVHSIRLLTRHDLTILGVEGYTALFVDGLPGGRPASGEVLGSGGVTVWNRANKNRYTQGETPVWREDER